MVDETGYHPESETKLAGLPHLWTCLTLDVSLLWPALTFFLHGKGKRKIRQRQGASNHYQSTLFA
jgi:hypothetical protein